MPRWNVIPTLHGYDVLEPVPSDLDQQFFGMGLADDELVPSSSTVSRYYTTSSTAPVYTTTATAPVNSRRPQVVLRRKSSGLSRIRNDRDGFQVLLDVNQFSPDEIQVKTVDRSILVRARHEEKVDEHGYVSREFTRRYPIPEDVEPSEITSTLSAEGILTIEGPRKRQAEPKSVERDVVIVRQQKQITDGDASTDVAKQTTPEATEPQVDRGV